MSFTPYAPSPVSVTGPLGAKPVSVAQKTCSVAFEGAWKASEAPRRIEPPVKMFAPE